MRYNLCWFLHLLQVFDIDELIKPRKEAAKKKMMDEIRDETIESAISKITAAKQTQQLEAAEEEDERTCRSHEATSPIFNDIPVIAKASFHKKESERMPPVSKRLIVEGSNSKKILVRPRGRHSGLMVSALDSRFEPQPGHCIVFLGKILYSHSASLHPSV